MKQRKRILHLQSGDGVSGGIAKYISNLIQSDKIFEFDHFVVVPSSIANELATKQLFPKSFIVSLPESYGVFSVGSYVNQLQSLIKRNKIDLVHSHALRSSVPAAHVCTDLRIPLIYTNHGLRYTQKGNVAIKYVFKLLEKYVCGRAAYTITIRPTDFKRAFNDRIVKCSKRVKFIATRLSLPVDRDNATPRRNLVIGVGSLIPVKRPDLFLNWVSALYEMTHEFEAVWAGDGPLRVSLIEQAEAAGLPITFVGNLNQTELSRLYSTAKLLLLTSDFETFPLSVLEAASKGVPTVCRQFAGAEDIIVHGHSGVILPPSLEANIGRFLWDLLQDRDCLKEISEGALARFKAEYFDVELTAKEYFSLYNRMFSSAFVGA